jgi:hypothetical protein
MGVVDGSCAMPVKVGTPLLVAPSAVGVTTWQLLHQVSASRRPAAASAFLCAGHVRQSGGESPLCNLMEVKHE